MKSKTTQRRAIKKIEARAKKEQDKLLKNAKKLKARVLTVEKKLLNLTKAAKTAKKKAQRKEKQLIKSLKKVKAAALKEKKKLSKKLKTSAQKVKQLKFLKQDGKVESAMIEENPIIDPTVPSNQIENSTTKEVEEV